MGRVAHAVFMAAKLQTLFTGDVNVSVRARDKPSSFKRKAYPLSLLRGAVHWLDIIEPGNWTMAFVAFVVGSL
jgi:hypothetical protein